MENEILEDFRTACGDFGKVLQRMNGGAEFAGTVTPVDVERAHEVGGYIDKETIEVMTAASGFSIGERIRIGITVYRIARVERGILTKIYAVEI